MPSMDRESHRIVIAGASSLLGAELKSLLEEGRFAGWDFRLLDEEDAAGTLTEAGGEATVIQPVEEGSFEKARFTFFTGSPRFTLANLLAAMKEGTVIDLSGETIERGLSTLWFPAGGEVKPAMPVDESPVYAVPTAAATSVSTLALGLAPLGLKGLIVLCALPVSEAGRAGIEELETQTSQLLSFQTVGKPVFDAQVAFTVLDRFGSGSSHSLAAARRRIRAEVKTCLGTKVVRPAVQVMHAPVFYGTVFSAWAELDKGATCQSILEACKKVGFFITQESESPSNMSAAGEAVIQLGMPEPEPAQVGSWWLWGAADNIRLPAANAVKLAAKLA
ncbi:MAG TPA: Asd/ArgC dimerization domain-containing protein [Candidatus Acidoferrum sp.]|nr:Asd/ArgC dimerization domain-containing protein [Candidatus Acidoferrum sp.]